MNYGRQGSRKLARQYIKAVHNKRPSMGVWLIRLALVGVVAGVYFAAQFALDLYQSIVNELPDVSTINITPEGYLSVVYDSEGREIETLASAGANRTAVKLSEVPINLQHAFVAIEDERFYTHNGIDLQGIVRAGAQGVAQGFHFSSGASTITQQLLKNCYFTSWVTEDRGSLDSFKRKIQEQYLAVQLEKHTTKDDILINYLNTINLGQNTLGVEAASQRYFSKSVSELELSECACIAAITQNPTKWNPISNPDLNNGRRKTVLKNMWDQGYITKAEYDEAVADDIYERITNVNESINTSSTSYFVDALTDAVVNDLVQAGYTATQAYQMLYSGGLSIYSTQDSRVQAIAEEQINDIANYEDHLKYSFSWRLTVNKADGSTKNYSEQSMLRYYQQKKNNPDYNINFKTIEECDEAIAKYKEEIMEPGDTVGEAGETIEYTLQPQAAMTIMENSTGKVIAIVGGRGEKDKAKTLNRAVSVTRQPGSTFKIVACFAAALDAGGKTLASVEDDAPFIYAGTEKEVNNYDKTFGGLTNIRKAITKSINIVTVRTMQDIGTGLGYQYAKNLGISTLDEGDNNLSLAIGGITRGVTNLELTAAYATIANEGYYNEPIFYTQVYDHAGNIILDNTNKTSRQVLKESTAWLLTSAMEDVVNAGTGTRAKFDGQTIAGKSGTTTKSRDALWAGYTPYYTAVVWGGFDDSTAQSYTNYPKNIWKEVMKRVHEGMARADFVRPEGIIECEVCRKSGLLPVEGMCDDTYTEYFVEGTEPTEYCDRHVVATRCNESGMLATSACHDTTRGVMLHNLIAGSKDSEVGCSLGEEGEQYCTLHEGTPLIYKTATQIAEGESMNLGTNPYGGYNPFGGYDYEYEHGDYAPDEGVWNPWN